MSKLVEFGTVSTETRAAYFNGKFRDGSKALYQGAWYYMTSDLDTMKPLQPAPQG